MTADVKRTTLAFLLLAALALALFASALPQLELKPGVPLPQWESGGSGLTIDAPAAPKVSTNSLVIAILLTVGGLLLTLGLVRLMQGLNWREILQEILKFSLVIACVGLLALAPFFLLGHGLVAEPPEPALPSVAPGISGPPLGAPPTTLLWIVWLGLGAVFAFLAIWLVRWSAHRTPSQDAVKLEAERAVEALRTGLDWRSVIIRCYEQMSRAMRKEQGITLEETMTAREFESLLAARGIPKDPVHELTLLFELARYADRAPGPESERRATDCLNAILGRSDGKQGAG